MKIVVKLRHQIWTQYSLIITTKPLESVFTIGQSVVVEANSNGRSLRHLQTSPSFNWLQ